MTLIEQLKHARIGHKSLGGAVLLAAGWSKRSRGYFLGPLYGWSSPDGKVYFDDDNFDREKWNPTIYVDAALSLIPKGWRVFQSGSDAIDNWYFHLIERQGLGTTDQVWGKTAPLALCIAALKAIEFDKITDSSCTKSPFTI